MLYGLCLVAAAAGIGSGTVAQIAQDKLLDGVSLYMTFRQFGASFGVALLTILIDHRETLHSSRLFEHLQGSGAATTASLASRAQMQLPHGYSNLDSHRLALAQLVEAAGSRWRH